ncbi:DJ-1/PfpI family protein [Rubrolithibacter danxiaensis]|uniref:DJ-1/PfpI family protein n=1 Tax=Rubrolithibacter danxiaensis TaxID=3390805 RepID=UPI003BF8E2A0
MQKLKVGMIIFPELTLLDFIGPYDVFVRADCFEVLVISENKGMIPAEGGLNIQADLSFSDCPDFDILFVPGGRGINNCLTNDVFISFLKSKGNKCSYITSVCTGSLLLAAAGLLDGFRATTHWRSIELLKMFGVEAVEERVVTDRNRITGGGITAGIDFGLTLTALIAGEDVAKTVQLILEYSPAPPFNCGSAKTAETVILENAKSKTQLLFDTRKKLIQDFLQKPPF